MGGETCGRWRGKGSEAEKSEAKERVQEKQGEESQARQRLQGQGAAASMQRAVCRDRSLRPARARGYASGSDGRRAESVGSK
eukprot:5850417-Pyramimonas_sp.AAC.1